MTNQTMVRVCGAGLLLLNPGRLVDWLLDRLEELSVAMMPVQAEVIPISCRESPVERRFD
jgi:hypothetical protein